MKVLGTGSYAAVLKVGRGKVLKVFASKSDRRDEWALHSAVQMVDPTHRFSVGAMSKGVLNPRLFPALFSQTMHDFSRKSSLGYIMYEYGGRTMKDPGILAEYPMVDILQFFLPLFQGLSVMRAHKVMHFDLKGENIVFQHRNGLRLIDFGFADQYADTCKDNCTNYAYHPVECSMLAHLFGTQQRAHAASVYHDRARAAVQAGLISLAGPLDTQWLQTVLNVMGFMATPAHAAKLLHNFRVGVRRLCKSENREAVGVEDAALIAMYRDRLAEFVALPYEDAWRTMVTENHEFHSKADVYGLGIQLASAFWAKHEHETSRGDTTLPVVYAQVVRLSDAMTHADVLQRIDADTALTRLENLLVTYGAPRPHPFPAPISVADLAPCGASETDTDTATCTATDTDTKLQEDDASGLELVSETDLGPSDSESCSSANTAPHTHPSGESESDSDETHVGVEAAAAQRDVDNFIVTVHRAAPVTGSKQGPMSTTSATAEQGGHVSADARTKERSRPTLSSTGTKPS
jgi:hypothetical protein